MTQSVTFLNGPPGCGKDEIAAIMALRYGFKHIKFASVIKNILCAALEINRVELEQLKETHCDVFNRTHREMLIHLSERYFKPTFGQDIFGRLSALRLQNTHREHVIVSDSGFIEEAIGLMDIVKRKNPGCKFTLIQIERPGHDFSNDSRSYITLPNRDPLRLVNNSSLKVFRAMGTRLVCRATGVEWNEQWTPME